LPPPRPCLTSHGDSAEASKASIHSPLAQRTDSFPGLASTVNRQTAHHHSPCRKSHTLSQSYSAILPTSLTPFESIARGFEPKTPAAVIGTTALEVHAVQEFFKAHAERTAWRKQTSNFHKKPEGLRIILIRLSFGGQRKTNVATHLSQAPLLTCLSRTDISAQYSACGHSFLLRCRK